MRMVYPVNVSTDEATVTPVDQDFGHNTNDCRNNSGSQWLTDNRVIYFCSRLFCAFNNGTLVTVNVSSIVL